MKNKTDTHIGGNFGRLEQMIRQRVDFLQEVVSGKQDLQEEESVSLRVSAHRDGYQYYLVTPQTGKNGTYLSGDKQKLIRSIAQKEYDRGALRSAQKELQMLLRYLRFSSHDSINKWYDRIPAGKRAWIKPAYPSDEECIRAFYAAEQTMFNPVEIKGDFYTEKGEHVRSKSEVMVAAALIKANIPYRYEFPLTLSGGTVIYPDFTILDMRDRKTVYFEHFGMMDDKEYHDGALARIEEYKKLGYLPGKQLLMTFESKRKPLGTKEIAGVINGYLL